MTVKENIKEKLTFLFAALGVIQTPYTIYIACLKTFDDTKPELHISVTDARPFTSPISITNNSLFFDMNDVELDCSLGTRTRKYSGVSSSFGEIKRKFDVPSGKTVVVECFEHRLIRKFESASIFPHLNYKTLGFERTYFDRFFIWYDVGKEPKWLESNR